MFLCVSVSVFVCLLACSLGWLFLFVPTFWFVYVLPWLSLCLFVCLLDMLAHLVVPLFCVCLSVLRSLILFGLAWYNVVLYQGWMVI